MNFADTLHKAKSSVKMKLTQRTYMTKVCTWSMSSSFWLVEGLPEQASLSTDVQPSLNQLYHSLICVMLMASLPKPAESSEWFLLGYCQASGKIWWNTNAWVVPSFSQKITMQWALRMHSHSRAGCMQLTLSAGGEKNPRMRMKVSSTSLPQRTSRASLVSAEKNHIGYFLNSPRTVPVTCRFLIACNNYCLSLGRETLMQ